MQLADCNKDTTMYRIDGRLRAGVARSRGVDSGIPSIVVSLPIIEYRINRVIMLCNNPIIVYSIYTKNNNEVILCSKNHGSATTSR